MAQDNWWQNDAPVGNAPAPQQPRTSAPPPFIPGVVTPRQQASEIRANNAEIRAQQDQAIQMERLRLEKEKAAKDKGAGSLDPKTQEGQKNIARGILVNSGVNLETGEDPVSDLIRGSTSGKLQHFGADVYGSVTGDPTSGMENIARLATIGNDMVLQMSGGSLGAQISNSDRDFIAARMGDIANPDKTAGERLAAWDQVKKRLAAISGMPQATGATVPGSGAIPPAGGNPPSGNAPIDLKPLPDANSVEKPVVGDMSGFKQVASGQMRNEPSPEDKATTDHINQMWLNGASMAEINGYLSAKGYPPSGAPTPEQAKYYRSHGGPFQINRFVPQSERQKAAAGPVGAYAAGAADSLTFGFSDELAGGANAALGGDYTQARDSFQGNKTAMAETHPLANVMGNISGAIMTGPVARAAGLQFAPNATRAAGAAMAANPVATSAGLGALYGAGMDNENRLRGAVLGGLTGGAVGKGMQSVAPAFNALAQSRVGQSVKNAMGGGTAAGTVPPAELIAAGKANNTRVMTSDAFPPTTALGKTARMTGENIPFIGTAGGRAAQQAERTAAVTRFAKEFQAEEGSIDKVTKNLIKTRGKQISDLTTAKNSVIESVPGTVPANNTLTALDGKIAELTARNTASSRELAGILQGMRKDFEGKTLPQLEAMRADELSSAFKSDSMAHIRDLGEKTMRSLYAPLKEDMAAFIKANGKPGDFNKWSTANAKLSSMMDDLKSSKFKSTLNNADTTPEDVARLLFSKTPSDVKRLVNDLSPKGQDKARSAIIAHALDKSTDDATGAVSPDKFLNAMMALKPSTEALFKGDHGARLDGLIMLLGGTRRAAGANAEISNGMQAAKLSVAGLAVTNPKIGIPAGLLARAYESPVVRDLLVKLGRSKAGSPAEKATRNRLADIITRLSVQKTSGAANDTFGTIFGQSPSRAAAQDESN